MVCPICKQEYKVMTSDYKKYDWEICPFGCGHRGKFSEYVVRVEYARENNPGLSQRADKDDS